MASRNPSSASNEHALLNVIKLFFSELEIDIKDLKNPTPQFVTNFYVAFLAELGVNIGNVFQIQLNQMTVISHVDMYNQTIPQLNIFHAVNHFAKNIGINDFSYNDIMNPDPKRTVSHFTAMMQFLEYCDGAVHKISPSIEQLVAQQKKKGELLTKIETLKRDINQRATNRVKRAERMKELERAIEEEKQKLDELVKEKEVQKQVMENVKKLMLEDEEKEMNLIRAVKESEEEVEKLKGMIVKSPEKLKNELNQLQNKKQECVNTIESLKYKFEQKKKLTNRFIADRNNQENRFQKLQELLELEKSAEKMREQLDEMKKKQTKYSEEIENIEIEISNLHQKSKTLKNNLEDLKSRKNKQNLENKESLDALQQEYNVLVANREKESARAIEVEKQIQAIREKEEELEADLKFFDEWLWDEYQNLCSKHQEIKDRFDKILEDAKRRNQRLLEDDGIL